MEENKLGRTRGLWSADVPPGLGRGGFRGCLSYNSSINTGGLCTFLNVCYFAKLRRNQPSPLPSSGISGCWPFSVHISHGAGLAGDIR